MTDKNIPTWEFEYECWNAGFENVAGIDEAGRGPLAGPVVAAAVILPKGIQLPDINDSKKLTPKKRDKIFSDITKHALDIGIGIISQDVIDEVNILQATILAMKEAVTKINSRNPEYLLIDGLELKDFHIPNLKIIKGDSRSISIAAASIIAKVTRDRIMQELDSVYPQYGFAVHKGYGTRKHLEAIEIFGPTKIHRKTFGGVKEHL